MKPRIIFIGLFLLQGCDLLEPSCFGAKWVGYRGDLYNPNLEKYFTIVNHTKNTYTDNALYSLYHGYKRLDNDKKDLSKPYLFYLSCLKYHHRIINRINPKQTINTEDEKLSLTSNQGSFRHHTLYITGNNGAFFMLSLNSGKQKIFFGRYNFHSKAITETDEERCTKRFIRWDIHPVWQVKNTKIHIYDDRIEIEKLDIMNKIKLDNDKEVELKTIPIIGIDVPGC